MNEILRPQVEFTPVSKNTTLKLFNQALSVASEVDQEEVCRSYEIIENAHDSFNNPKRKNRATSAFLIHSRRTSDSDSSLDDVGRVIPSLAQKYDIPHELVDKIWNSLPPFELGSISGKLSSGQDIDCALISVPITPTGLAQAGRATDRFNYSFPKIKDAVQLASNLGADVVGLGETLASLTSHGKKLKEQYPDVEIVTGHTGTTYLINEWIRFGAQVLDKDLSDTSVTIIGAYGAIGSVVGRLLANEGVGRLSLHDKEDKVGGLKNIAAGLVNDFPYLSGRIDVSGGDISLAEACKRGEIIMSAASAPSSFIRSEHLNEGTIIVDDSQPPSITREEAEKAKSHLFWVVGSHPDLRRDFDYGIDGEWGCALEVVAMEARRGEFVGVGPVTIEGAEKFRGIAKDLGIGISYPQSFGEPVKLI